MVLHIPSSSKIVTVDVAGDKLMLGLEDCRTTSNVSQLSLSPSSSIGMVIQGCVSPVVNTKFPVVDV